MNDTEFRIRLVHALERIAECAEILTSPVIVTESVDVDPDTIGGGKLMLMPQHPVVEQLSSIAGSIDQLCKEVRQLG